MSDLRRLLRFVKPYWSPLILSVILMAIAGAAHAMMAVLIGPIFDRVLDPSSPERPVELLKLPFANCASISASTRSGSGFTTSGTSSHSRFCWSSCFAVSAIISATIS